MSEKCHVKRLLLVCLLLFCSGCSEEGSKDISIGPPISSSTISFKNVQSSLRIPSQVRFTFRLADSENHAVLIPEAELHSAFEILENGQQIDYSETSYFVSNAAGLELDMILLLDFSRSMMSLSDDSTAAIVLMVGWVRDLIDQMGAGHRISIMEYHDRNLDADVIVPFTSDRSVLHQGLDEFLARDIDNGSSRNWDALHSAVELFPSDSNDARQRLILFFTDGKETSSEITPGEVVAAAQNRQVSIFVVAVGSISNQGSLESVAEQTDGGLYLAANISAFSERLDEIKRDLGGQYSLSYVSLKRSGSHLVAVRVNYQGLRGGFEELLDLGSVYGDDRVGIITFADLTREVSSLRVTVQAEHVPRNIDRFRFRLDTDKPISVTLPSAETGGLCEDWYVYDADVDNWIEAVSETALAFGAHGSLWQIEIGELIEAEIFFEFTLDTGIYTSGKTFTYPRFIIVGQPDFARYDFESGDIPPIFANNSAVNWRIDGGDAHGGNYSARTGDFSAAGAATISLTTDVGFADTVSFYLRIDNAAGLAEAGRCEFYIDDDLILRQPGRLSWTRFAEAIPPGAQRFSWRFVVLDSELGSSPHAWIDDIVLR